MNSKQKTVHRRSSKWKNFRKYLIKKRGFTCEICGMVKQSKYCQLHHIHEDAYGNETEADVVLLCPADHKIIERLLKRTKNPVDIDLFCKNLKRIYKDSM